MMFCISFGISGQSVSSTCYYFNLIYSNSRVLNIANDDTGIFNALSNVYVTKFKYGVRRPCSRAKLTTTDSFFVVGNFTCVSVLTQAEDAH